MDTKDRKFQQKISHIKNLKEEILMIFLKNYISNFLFMLNAKMIIYH